MKHEKEIKTSNGFIGRNRFLNEYNLGTVKNGNYKISISIILTSHVASCEAKDSAQPSELGRKNYGLPYLFGKSGYFW